MIASAHGTLVGLVQNKELNDLVGGIQSVILGAGERVLAGGLTLPKVVEERISAPVFDVIVELSKESPGTFKVFTDTSKAVDCILLSQAGVEQVLLFHERSRDPETNDVFFKFRRQTLRVPHANRGN